MNESKLAVYVIDDESAVTAGLEGLLSVAGYEVVTFASAEAFLARLDSVSPGSLVLADVCMPGIDGIELMNRLREQGQELRVIIMTGHASVHMAVSALRAGAVDFVEKPFSRDELFGALERAFARQHPKHSDRKIPAELMERIETLSPREREVMNLMISGEPSKVIARHLGISPRTVEVHRSHVLHKMDARNLADLIHKTARLGIPTNS